MNDLLWTLQILTALMYLTSGVMKVFLFDRISKQDKSFAALQRPAWLALGILELICAFGLIVPAAFHWHPALTALAAAILALESLVFLRVHTRYDQIPPIILSAALGLVMAFLAYGRIILAPIA